MSQNGSVILFLLKLLLLLGGSAIFFGRQVNGEDVVESSPWWEEVSLSIHRNGEPDPCGTTRISTSSQISKKFINILSSTRNKYQVESSLTDLIANNFLIHDDDGISSCSPTDNSSSTKGLYGYCDMGKDRTPILLDYEKLIKVKGGSSGGSSSGSTLPCRWYTREGLRITSWEQLGAMAKKAKEEESNGSKTCQNNNDQEGGGDCSGSVTTSTNTEIHLYGVPAGRVFQFAASYVGEMFTLNHLSLVPDPNIPITMKVLSVEPRVFDIYDVFTVNEADSIVERALSEDSPSHKMKRSTTGTIEHSVFSRRTSENAFDTHGLTAFAVKKRIFELLGFDEYWDGHDDGLQVLRYNTTAAYTPHMDYLTDRSGKELYDYDSSKKGGNRFATILLYMTDLPEHGGGETVFSEAWPTDVLPTERKMFPTALKELRASGDAARAGIEEGSWEEKMVATCRSRFSLRPHRGRAVLFYSQHPDGSEDKKSKHGGCPVLDGTKWAANLWVWNAQRKNYAKAPLREDLIAKGYKPAESQGPQQLSATFYNSGRDPAMDNAELWYDEGRFWGKMNPGHNPYKVNTFEGHRWNIRVDGVVVKNILIGKDKEQEFRI